MNDRGDAVTSLVYEATARLQDPVYGCVAIISSLQKCVFQLQSELDEVLAQTIMLRTQQSSALSLTISSQSYECINDASDSMLLYPHLDLYTEPGNMPL